MNKSVTKFFTVLGRLVGAVLPAKWWNSWRVEEGEASSARFADPQAVWRMEGQTVSYDIICEVRRVEVDGRQFYIKKYIQPGKGLRGWLIPSRVRSEWKNLLLFHSWGVPAPRLVAYGEMRHGNQYQGMLVTAALTDTQGLDALADRLRQRQWRDSVLRQAARHLAVLHGHGFAHGDLNWRNILVTRGGEPQLYFIDCPAGRFWPWPLLAAKKAKDLWLLDKLGRQYLSRTQRLCFYLLYRGVGHLDAKDKRLLRGIAGKVRSS